MLSGPCVSLLSETGEFVPPQDSTEQNKTLNTPVNQSLSEQDPQHTCQSKPLRLQPMRTELSSSPADADAHQITRLMCSALADAQRFTKGIVTHRSLCLFEHLQICCVSVGLDSDLHSKLEWENG